MFEALLVQVFPVDVDAEVGLIFVQLDADYVTLLVLQDVLGEHVCALSVGLSPLLRHGVEEAEAEDRLAEVVGHACLKQHGSLVRLYAKERVDLGEDGQIEPTHVSATLFVGRGNSAKLVVPRFALLIARLVFLLGDRVGEFRCRFALSAIDQFASAVAEELVTGHVDSVASNCLLSKLLGLLFRGKLDRVEVNSAQRIV